MSDRIDHAAEAGICINYARETESANEALLSMMQAQAEATLALVEQQRIHNLISLAQGGRGGTIGLENITLDALRTLHVAGDEPWPAETVELRPEIREALGL